jgi:uncharacterized protein (DUF934 family)
MQIIKDTRLIDDNWQFCPDESTVQDDADITVSVARLLAEGDQLLQRPGRLGVRIEPSNSIDQLKDYLPKLTLIELHFPELADGRLFSHAWLLRNRYGYKGELRAAGHFLPDQVFYLSRVGVNSFSPENTANLSATLAGLKDFSVKYQPSVN